MENTIVALLGITIAGGISLFSLLWMRISGVDTRIDKLGTRIDTRIDAQGTRIDTMIGEFGAVQRELSGINRSLGELISLAHTHQSIA